MRLFVRSGLSSGHSAARFSRLSGIGIALALSLLSVPAPALGQSGSAMADRLPARTIAYVQWKGTASLSSASGQNQVLQLWHDPEFSSLQATLVSHWMAANTKPGVTLPTAAVASLLENPAIAGVVAPETAAGAKPGVFLVYNASGKAPLIQMMMALRHAARTSESSTYDFGGTKIEVQTAGAGKSYIAEAGGFVICSSEKHLIEDLVTRFSAPGLPSRSILQVADYQQVRKYLGSDGIIEGYIRIADLVNLAASENESAKAADVLRNLHLARVHAAGWSFSFEGEATRSRGVVFGNTVPGSPFDFIGASTATFSTEPIADGSASFTASRFDWAALYRLVRGAVSGALPEQQASNVAMMEGVAQSFLGMPIEDALGLFSGEVTRATSYAPDGTTLAVTAIAIQRPNDVLRILRAMLAPITLSEDSSGDSTFLDIAYPYKDPVTGIQRRKMYYVAVTPTMILAAPRKGMLTHAAQEMATASAAGSASAKSDPFAGRTGYQDLRTRLPEKLSGLSVTDWSQVPIEKLVSNFVGQIEGAAKQSNKTHPPDLSFLRSANFGAIQRHLHMSVGGWWKDSNGIYFDSYSE